MWQVGIVPAGRSEVTQRLWHQKESFSSFFFFFPCWEMFCVWASGKCHFAFWGGPVKMKVFAKPQYGWHFLVQLSIPRPKSWSRMWWCRWYEKLTVGGTGQKQTFSAVGQTIITSHLNYWLHSALSCKGVIADLCNPFSTPVHPHHHLPSMWLPKTTAARKAH